MDKNTCTTPTTVNAATMEYSYYIPPQDHSTGSQEQYQHYQYGAGYPALPALPHVNPHAAYDSISLNADHYTNFEGEHDHGIPNFDDSFIPMETQDELHGNNSVQDYRTNLVTVYKKAPDAPKRFRSSYVHFFMDFLEKKRQTPGLDGLPVKLDISSASKECSQAWKSLPEDQRKYWHDLSEAEKRGFNEQKAAFQGPWRIATSKVKQKKEGAPKRSPSAFFLFMNARRPLIKGEHPDMPNNMVVKTCSNVWKQLPESEKAPYLEEERKRRAQYHIDADHWRRNVQVDQEGKSGQIETANYDEGSEQEKLIDHFPLPGPTRLVEPIGETSNPVASTRAKKRTRDRDPNAPKRSPPAFFLFVNHCRSAMKQDYPELRHTELVKLLGQKWSEMSEDEKKPFRNQEEILRQQYHIDIKHYKKQAISEYEYNALGPMGIQHAHLAVQQGKTSTANDF